MTTPVASPDRVRALLFDRSVASPAKPAAGRSPFRSRNIKCALDIEGMLVKIKATQTDDALSLRVAAPKHGQTCEVALTEGGVLEYSVVCPAPGGSLTQKRRTGRPAPTVSDLGDRWITDNVLLRHAEGIFLCLWRNFEFSDY